MIYLLFGGAFNPPTNAHIQLAEIACKSVNADKVIFMPSKMTYIKEEQDKNFAFTDSQRYEMLKKICKNRPLLTVSDYELKKDKQPRTYETLVDLKKEGKNCKLLIGSDKLIELESNWLYVENIAKEFGIVCMERGEDNCKEIIEKSPFLTNIKEYIQLVQTPLEFKNISSTKVRKIFLNMKNEISELKEILPKELNGLLDFLIKEE